MIHYQGLPKVLVKNWQFFHLFIIGEIGQEKCVWEYSRKKKAFPDYKNNKLKKWKICDFSKGVSPWLWLKIGNFSIFYWNIGKIAQQSVFESILERKKAFPDYKNNKIKVKKVKNLGFFQRGCHWFWSKIGNFSISST